MIYNKSYANHVLFLQQCVIWLSRKGYLISLIIGLVKSSTVLGIHLLACSLTVDSQIGIFVGWTICVLQLVLLKFRCLWGCCFFYFILFLTGNPSMLGYFMYQLLKGQTLDLCKTPPHGSGKIRLRHGHGPKNCLHLGEFKS